MDPPVGKYRLTTMEKGVVRFCRMVKEEASLSASMKVLAIVLDVSQNPAPDDMVSGLSGREVTGSRVALSEHHDIFYFENEPISLYFL